jgi:hypothetical protein
VGFADKKVNPKGDRTATLWLCDHLLEKRFPIRAIREIRVQNLVLPT